VLVFTAFHETTKTWFIVSSEESVERSWTLLKDSLETGHHGPLMDHFNQYGEEGFTLEVWGEADSASDARALVREAQAELGAQVQGMPRKQTKKPGLSLDQIKSFLNEASEEVKPKVEKKPIAAKSAKADGGRDEMHQVMVAIEARRLSMKKSAADKRRAEARKSARKTKPAIPQRTGDEKMDELLARLDQRAASASRRT